MLEKTQKLCIIKYTNKMLNTIKALNKKQNVGESNGQHRRRIKGTFK